MGAASGLNLLNFFNFFAFKTEKVHFTPKNRSRIVKLRVYTDRPFNKKNDGTASRKNCSD